MKQDRMRHRQIEGEICWRRRARMRETQVMRSSRRSARAFTDGSGVRGVRRGTYRSTMATRTMELR